jgi:hypothetical protein
MGGGGQSKLAVTVLLSLMDTVVFCEFGLLIPVAGVQLTNVHPVLGVAVMLAFVPASNVPPPLAVPPVPALTVSVYVVAVIAVHCAKTLVLASNTVLVFTAVPPVAAVNQPSNVWSLLVGVGRLVNWPSVPVVADVG